MLDNELLSVDNGTDKVVSVDAQTLAREYYTSYSKYVLEYRALPSIEDGLKPVQRRIIYTASQFPQKLMKTAKMVGAVMAYHPHGDSSIAGAINDMAHPLNALPLFTTKGNFGGVGFGASATRYTELYLSEVARYNFCQFIDYAEYETGEIGEREPSALPCLIPYALFKGSEGIGIGLSTKVMPLNLIDLIDYYIDFIKNDGFSKRLIKPDVGYVLIEQDDDYTREIVQGYRGKLYVSSIVTQMSDTAFLIEGVFGRSIDAVINRVNKLDNCIDSGKVGFRDASSSSMKYVFEIYDSSISPARFKEHLEWATRASNTFTRVMEDNGSAVYTNLNYVVKRSLQCLNRAIDKKLELELIKNQKQLTLYEVLRRCKELGVFKDITQMTSEELVQLIIRSTDCDREIAWEITKRPISYLTRSHDKEEEDLKSNIEMIQGHDRKKYLLKLYKDFRRMVMPIYESKKHSVSQSSLLKNPHVYLSDSTIVISDSKGEEFDSTIYLIDDKGYFSRKLISTSSSASIPVDGIIKGLVTDRFKYIEIVTRFTNEKWGGRAIIDTQNVKYDKRVISLRDLEGERIVEVKGLNDVPEDLKYALKGTKTAKTSYYKL